MGRLNIMLVFNVLIIVMILAYEVLVASRRESGRPIFLEATFGLTHMYVNEGLGLLKTAPSIEQLIYILGFGVFVVGSYKKKRNSQSRERTNHRKISQK
jgi:hypothetical protein